MANRPYGPAELKAVEDALFKLAKVEKYFKDLTKTPCDCDAGVTVGVRVFEPYTTKPLDYPMPLVVVSCNGCGLNSTYDAGKYFGRDIDKAYEDAL